MKRWAAIVLAILVFPSFMLMPSEEMVINAEETTEDIFLGIDHEFPHYSTENRFNITMDTSLPFNMSGLSSFQFEISTTGEIGLTGDWQDAENIIEKDLYTSIVVFCWFKNGKDNWVRFKVINTTGSTFISDGYNVWVDSEGPRFNLISHSEDEYQLDPRQLIRVLVEDLLSGVNASSIQYRCTTSGLQNMSEWMDAEDLENGDAVTLYLDLLLARGDRNFIQARAKDIAGNPILISRAYNIKVNTIPTPVVTSPLPNETFPAGESIVFDASGSYDNDGDRIDHIWTLVEGDNMDLLGETAVIIAELEPDTYNISLRITDRVGNMAWYNFTIIVNETEQEESQPNETIDPEADDDNDGMPNWYEMEKGFNISIPDGHLDPDGDGVPSIVEYEEGYDPLDGEKYPEDRVQEVEEEVDVSYVPLIAGMITLGVFLFIIAVIVVVVVVVVSSKKKDDDEPEPPNY